MGTANTEIDKQVGEVSLSCMHGTRKANQRQPSNHCHWLVLFGCWTGHSKNKQFYYGEQWVRHRYCVHAPLFLCTRVCKYKNSALPAPRHIGSVTLFFFILLRTKIIYILCQTIPFQAFLQNCLYWISVLVIFSLFCTKGIFKTCHINLVPLQAMQLRTWSIT